MTGPSIGALRVKALRDRTAAGVMDCKRALIETGDDLDAAVGLLKERRLTAARLERRPTPEGLVACQVQGRRGVVIELAAETDFVSRTPQFREAAANVARAALEAGGELDATLAAPSPDGRGDVADYVAGLAATFGEAVVLRRVAGLETQSGVIGAYAHNGPAPGLGRMVALAAVSGTATDALPEIARKLAMHIVAAAPLWTRLEEVPASVREQKRHAAADAFDRMLEARLDRFYEQTVLERQRSLLAPELTVAQTLAAEAGPNARIDGFVCLRIGEDASHDARVAQAAEFEWSFGNDWSKETPARLATIGDVPVFEVSPAGPKLRDDRDAVDLINAAWSHGARFIALPVERLGDDFFPLSTRKAGAILQKFSNFGAQIAIVGDISAEVARSPALRDFIYESNRRGQVCFVTDLGRLAKRLKGG